MQDLVVRQEPGYQFHHSTVRQEDFWFSKLILFCNITNKISKAMKVIVIAIIKQTFSYFE